MTDQDMPGGERREVRLVTLSWSRGWDAKVPTYVLQPGETVLSASTHHGGGNQSRIDLVVEGPMPSGEQRMEL